MKIENTRKCFSGDSGLARGPSAVSSRGLGHSPLKAGTRVRIPLPLFGSRPHRLSVRTALFQGAERGSTPLGAIARPGGEGRCLTRDARSFGAVAQLVRVPVCHTGGRGFEPRRPRSQRSVAVSSAALRPQRYVRSVTSAVTSVVTSVVTSAVTSAVSSRELPWW